jgi:Zn-dependent protease with chaperone function
MLARNTILAFAAVTCMTLSCLAADPYTGVFERLNRIEPLPQLSPEVKTRIISLLPKQGEVQVLSVAQRRKLDSLVPVLKAHNREYLVKVVESPAARIAIHARFVVLITDTALRILNTAGLQAIVAHEIGHEYVWEEYEDARKRNDWTRQRELELFCDGVSMLTLARIGAARSALIDALRIMYTVNRRNGFMADPVRHSHPSLAERVRFGKAMMKRLAEQADHY